jgi:hypothetical protein
MNSRYAGAPFIAIGLAFIALGLTGNRPFLFIGVAFLAIGLAVFARGRRPGASG